MNTETAGPSLEEQAYTAPKTENNTKDTRQEDYKPGERIGLKREQIIMLVAILAIAQEMHRQQMFQSAFEDMVQARGGQKGENRFGSMPFEGFTSERSRLFDDFTPGAARKETPYTDAFRTFKPGNTYSSPFGQHTANPYAGRSNGASKAPKVETITHEYQPLRNADTAPLPFSLTSHTKTPGAEDMAARKEAGTILREGLKAQGWDGGQVTEEMRTKALREGIKKVHSDKTGEDSGVSGGAARFITAEFDSDKRAKAERRRQEDEAANRAKPANTGASQAPKPTDDVS